ncbi:MAG TPA: PqqD family protein [Polyangia bacterium]|jgi:hypothetical protein|nr:PqqD family protein [Polyangia bacterium]
MAPGLGDTVRPGKNVASRDTKDGAMLVDLDSGACWQLNHVGAEVWRTISGEGGSLAGACEAVAARYDVPRDAVEKDVLALVGDLHSRGLISVEPRG